MAKYGLTDERYEQMRKYYSDEDIKDIVDEWYVDNVNKAYIISDYDGTGLLGIEKLDVVDAFDGDEEAAIQAEKDGLKIIPVDELPENFDFRWFGWIDTPANREAIKKYSER